MNTVVGPAFEYDGTLTFGSVSSSATNWTEQTVTLPNSIQFPNWGKKGGSPLLLELPDLDASIGFCGVWANSSTSFKVRFWNATGSPVTPTGTNAKLMMF